MSVIEIAAVDKRVVRMRDLAADDLVSARQDAWAWVVELGHRVHRRRQDALLELWRLFSTGVPSTGIDGPARGSLVTFTTNPLVDRLTAAALHAWNPWLGAVFDADSSRGVTALAPSAWLPARVLWPKYRMALGRNAIPAFAFTTREVPSMLDPDQNVLLVDYGGIAANPSLLISSLRVELVEVVPGIHLGKLLLALSDGPALLGYVALRTDDHV